MKTSVVAALSTLALALGLAGGLAPSAPAPVLAMPCCKAAGQ